MKSKFHSSEIDAVDIEAEMTSIETKMLQIVARLGRLQAMTILPRHEPLVLRAQSIVRTSRALSDEVESICHELNVDIEPEAENGVEEPPIEFFNFGPRVVGRTATGNQILSRDPEQEAFVSALAESIEKDIPMMPYGMPMHCKI
ncbi:hypothetical protein TW83_10085 [Paracoccus sp. S4493]|uniref:hypothetical protein n=1 Tax=Paracoccus sp. S4493 TaxID=579490 RepID=UPI0005FA57DB|nr:hypothetical protein [Paracoccus sp. S4493]KJZ31260.1 hypothetical protein TW83_10085 [Paracoccus sp. S4493]